MYEDIDELLDGYTDPFDGETLTSSDGFEDLFEE